MYLQFWVSETPVTLGAIFFAHRQSFVPTDPPRDQVNEPALHRALQRVVAVRPGEVRALAWSFAYFFCLLAGYYVLRPLRDEMGIAGGVRNLQWLFTATFFVMLAAVPVFGDRKSTR